MRGTQVNRLQTLYRVNKDPLFTGLGPDRETPPIGKARVLSDARAGVRAAHAHPHVPHSIGCRFWAPTASAP